MEAKKQAGRSPAACFAEWPLSSPTMRPTRSVTASPQAPDPSLRRQRQSSLLPLRLLFPTRTASLGSRGGLEGGGVHPSPICRGGCPHPPTSFVPASGFGQAATRSAPTCVPARILLYSNQLFHTGGVFLWDPPPCTTLCGPLPPSGPCGCTCPATRVNPCLRRSWRPLRPLTSPSCPPRGISSPGAGPSGRRRPSGRRFFHMASCLFSHRRLHPGGPRRPGPGLQTGGDGAADRGATAPPTTPWPCWI